jgi:hypothetical protein
MKRHLAFAAAAALFATGTATPALAAPAAHRDGMPDCIPVENGCMPVDSIGENTQIYIGQQPGGAVQGFTDFANFADWARAVYKLDLDGSGGFMHVDYAGGGHGDDNSGGEDNSGDGDDNGGHGDGDDNGGHGHGDGDGADSGHGHGDDDGRGDGDGGGFVMGRATFTTFYDRSTLSGPGFVLDPPNTIFDLRDVRMPGGGTWNNEISSFRVVGGNPGKPGVVLCAQVGCKTTGWIQVFNNGEELQLTGGFNNTASSVGVFSG